MLLRVSDAFPADGRVALAGVNPDLELSSPAAFRGFAGRVVDVRMPDGRAVQREIKDAKAVMALSGQYNLFILVDPIGPSLNPEHFIGAEVWLLG